jgi:hypothetical protein
MYRLINKIFKNNQTETQNSRVKIQKYNSKVKSLEKEVEEQTELEVINNRLTKLEGDLEKAVSGYKQLLIGNNPDILPELIGGDSIEAIDRSLKTAKELTDRIREKLEQKTAAERIPSGAPPRAPPDITNLSSHEKIIYGLEKQ